MSLVSVRVRVTIECPECAYPIPVNAVVASVQCHACQALLPLEGELGWNKITTYAPREGIRKTTGGLTLAARPVPVLDNYLLRPSRVHRRFEGILFELDDRPIGCLKCRAPQDPSALASMAQKGATEAHCTACGAAISLRSLAATRPQIACSCATLIALVGETGLEATQAPSGSLRPVLFNCLGCGAPLELDDKTPRILDCKYCQATSYMPDPLWLELHPAHRKRPFFLLLDQRATPSI